MKISYSITVDDETVNVLVHDDYCPGMNLRFQGDEYLSEYLHRDISFIANNSSDHFKQKMIDMIYTQIHKEKTNDRKM